MVVNCTQRVEHKLIKARQDQIVALDFPCVAFGKVYSGLRLKNL